MPKIAFPFITLNNVALFVGDLLALDNSAFQPALAAWAERFYQSLIEGMKEQAQLTRYTRTKVGLWSASYAAAMEENLQWQVTAVQSLGQVMKPEIVEQLTASWKERRFIPPTGTVSLL
jgi:hypothetical protein